MYQVALLIMISSATKISSQKKASNANIHEVLLASLKNIPSAKMILAISRCLSFRLYLAKDEIGSMSNRRQAPIASKTIGNTGLVVTHTESPANETNNCPDNISQTWKECKDKRERQLLTRCQAKTLSWNPGESVTLKHRRPLGWSQLFCWSICFFLILDTSKEKHRLHPLPYKCQRELIQGEDVSLSMVERSEFVNSSTRVCVFFFLSSRNPRNQLYQLLSDSRILPQVQTDKWPKIEGFTPSPKQWVE